MALTPHPSSIPETGIEPSINQGTLKREREGAFSLDWPTQILSSWLRQYSFAKRSSNLTCRYLKGSRKTFVRKSRAKNIGEIDTNSTYSTSTLFSLLFSILFCCLFLTLRTYLSSIEESRVDKIEWDNWELLFIELPISKEGCR